MEMIRKINDELAIAGQLPLDQLPQVLDDGFCSILNLRSPQEDGFLVYEEAKVELLGFRYANFPLIFDRVQEDLLLQLFKLMNELPKPLLVHCDTGIRSALTVLMYITMQQGATPKQAFRQAEQLGVLTPAIPEV